MLAGLQELKQSYQWELLAQSNEINTRDDAHKKYGFSQNTFRSSYFQTVGC